VGEFEMQNFRALKIKVEIFCSKIQEKEKLWQSNLTQKIGKNWGYLNFCKRKNAFSLIFWVLKLLQRSVQNNKSLN
jgi:hypothetical protein